MKLDSYLAQYLYASKTLTLQGIGKFTLNPDVTISPETSDKDVVLPENAIAFETDKKAVEDADLVNYVTLHTKKMKSLVSADIDSYFMLGKQFLNIGKPFKIEGVGTLLKTQQNDYDFTQANYANLKVEAIATIATEKIKEPISFKEEKKPSFDIGKIIKPVAIGFGIIALGAGIWYLAPKVFSSSKTANDVAEKTTATSNTDTAITKKPELLIAKDSNTFRLVLAGATDSLGVAISYAKLSKRGHKLEIVQLDSNKYALKMPFKNSIADTARVRDSIYNYYLAKGVKPKIEISQ
jgi:hypothetical protein